VEDLLAPAAPAKSAPPPGVTKEVYDAARATMLDPKASATDKRIAIGILKPEGADGAEEETASGRRSAERLEMSRQAAAQKATEDTMKTYVMDTRAFVRPTEWLAKGKGTDAEGNIKEVTPEQMTEANLYEKDPVAAEKNYAINAPSVQAYVDKVKGLSPVQYEKRRKFAEWARNEAAAPATGGSSPVRDLGI
jgi:hypothetical protein